LNYYAGIGSRETPIDILHLFKKVACYLSTKQYILRSGHAPGADQNFELGCDNCNGQKEIYLPWPYFEGSGSIFNEPTKEAYEIAEKFHPYWHNLSQGARKLQARNSHQVLGLDLNTPSKFVICWTKNGKDQGGTSQAIRVARAYDIPIFNAGSYNGMMDAKKELNYFLIENGVG